MNREEVIKLAKQSGLFVELVLERDLDWLERFAALVASAEREACAKIVEDEAMQYAEPVWAFEIVNDIKARGQA